MTVSTPAQPDYTAQSGSTYKSTLDAAVHVGWRAMTAFAVFQTPADYSPTGPDMHVQVAAGHITGGPGAAVTEVAAQELGPLVAPTTNPRNDVVVVDRNTGVASVISGAEAASPADPAITTDTLPLARIALTVGMTEITNADLTDLRATFPAFGSAAQQDVGTTAGDVVQLDGSAKLPAVDGSQLTGITAGASATDMRLAFLLIAENNGDRLNMVDGIADPFADESDVDTAGSTNENYNAGSDYYSGGTATAIGSMTDTTNGDWSSITAFVQRIPASAFSSGVGVRVKMKAGDAVTFSNVYIGHRATSGDNYDFASTPTQVTFNSGSGSIALGSGASAWSDYLEFPVNGSTDILIAYNHNNVTNLSAKATLSGYSSWYKISDNPATVNKSGYTLEPRDVHSVDDFEVTQTANLTLVSEAFTADSAPATGRIHAQVKENEAVTINTDLMADVSRDGGTTWTAATLALVETLADGTKAYEDADVDLTSQPSGTAMKWRLRTANTKDIEAHGIVFQWS